MLKVMVISGVVVIIIFFMDEHVDDIIITIIHQKSANQSGLNILGSLMDCSRGEFNMNSTCYG